MALSQTTGNAVVQDYVSWQGNLYFLPATEEGIRIGGFGGADGIRTHDLLDAIEARSQLRHGPTGEYFKSLSHPAGNLMASCASHFSKAGFRILLDAKQPRRYPEAHNS